MLRVVDSGMGQEATPPAASNRPRIAACLQSASKLVVLGSAWACLCSHSGMIRRLKVIFLITPRAGHAVGLGSRY